MKKLISISLLLLLACGPSKEEFDAREKRKDDSLKAIQDVSNAMNDHNIIIDVSKNLTDHNSFKVDFRKTHSKYIYNSRRRLRKFKSFSLTN